MTEQYHAGHANYRPRKGRYAVSCLLLLALLFSPPAFAASSAGLSSPQGAPAAAAQDPDYILGAEDEISIIVWDHPDLIRKTRINLEGRISFPLIGELRVAGLTQLHVEKKLRDMLADGYIVDPQVSVQVTDYRSQKVFVIGEVNSPGAYPLTRRTLLVEAVAMAGGVKQEADHEIVIVRPKRSQSLKGPLLPEQADPSELIRVRLGDVLREEPERRGAEPRYDIRLQDQGVLCHGRGKTAGAVYLYERHDRPAGYQYRRRIHGKGREEEGEDGQGKGRQEG